ncbi:MAG: hypothetical protein K8S56_01190 [Candidatus Cloacimonetes bacterium]|nr:hypothetical protein [Candidatus Cloacimonadota bacterium]
MLNLPSELNILKSGKVYSVCSSNFIPAAIAPVVRQIGLPVWHENEPMPWMQGASSFAATQKLLPLSHEEARRFTAGEDIRKEVADGLYFAAYKNTALGIVKASRGRLANKFPAPMRVR